MRRVFAGRCVHVDVQRAVRRRCAHSLSAAGGVRPGGYARASGGVAAHATNRSASDGVTCRETMRVTEHARSRPGAKVEANQPEMGMAGNIPVNATVVDPSTKTVHREVPAMVRTIHLIEG